MSDELPIVTVTTHNTPTHIVEAITRAAHDLGLPLQIGSAPRSRPKLRGVSDEERERIRRMTAIRERAQACGWSGPYRVQVVIPTISVGDQWRTWLDLPTAHDRLGTALARCRALVHGLPDGVKPGWYGDRLSTLGTHLTARVIDAHGRVLREEHRS